MKSEREIQGPTVVVDGPVQSNDPWRVGRSQNYYLCDDGCWYTMRQLSEIIGVAYHTVKTRMLTYGVCSPLVFFQKSRRGYMIDGSPQEVGDAEPGNAAWQQLGNVPRTRNLDKIREPGSYELRL